MLDFLTPKTKLQVYGIREVPIEMFDVLGIGQINPYCNNTFENEVFVTAVNLAYDFKRFDEKEGLILTKYFTVKKCPKCRKIELIPTKIRINLDSVYKAHEEEIAFDAFEEHPSKRHFPSMIEAYCNNCSTCFEMKIKSKDIWVKEAKKIKDKDLILPWQEYYND